MLRRSWMVEPQAWRPPHDGGVFRADKHRADNKGVRVGEDPDGPDEPADD